MNIEELREYCLSKKGTSESFPFDDETLVFKVGGKMFLLVNIFGPLEINLKCDPEKAIALREEFSNIKQAYHMNKKHWITVETWGNISHKLILSWIDDSYNLVFEKLPGVEKEKILKNKKGAS